VVVGRGVSQVWLLGRSSNRRHLFESLSVIRRGERRREPMTTTMTSSFFVGDDELRAVYRLYAASAETEGMDLYQFKCAVRHVYGDSLKRPDLRAVLGDAAVAAAVGMSAAEFVAAARAYERWKHPGGGNANKQLMQQSFAALDTRDKGYVDAEDVARVLRQIVPRLQCRRGGSAHDVFAGLDELGVGKVTFPRFCSLHARSTGVKCL